MSFLYLLEVLNLKGNAGVYIWSWDSADDLSQNNLIFTKNNQNTKTNKKKTWDQLTSY